MTLLTDFNHIFDRLYNMKTTGEDLKGIGFNIMNDPYINKLIKEDIIHKLLIIIQTTLLYIIMQDVFTKNIINLKH